MEVTFTDRVKAVAQMVEKFVEHNIVEKDQRDENLRKLALAFETLIKDSPLRKGFDAAQRAATSAVYANEAAEAGASAATDAASAGVSFTTANHMNQKIDVQVKKLENFKGDLPRYQSALASGLDVRAQLSEAIVLQPGQRVLVPTGLAFAIPQGYEIQARPRSGWAIRDGVTLLNTPGTIDADYRGEVKIIVANLGQNDVTIQDQDRIAQLVLCPVVQAQFQVVENLDSTERGAGGFGSTGRK